MQPAWGRGHAVAGHVVPLVAGPFTLSHVVGGMLLPSAIGGFLTQPWVVGFSWQYLRNGGRGEKKEGNEEEMEKGN